MSTARVAIIGTGAKEAGGMGKAHAKNYLELEGVDLVSCADIDEEAAHWFAEAYGIDAANVFTDYREMLENVELDLVSVCTPITTHAEIVLDCITSGQINGVHCEKPIAHTWGDCLRMADAAAEHDVQLTISHQLRHCEPVRRMHAAVSNGDIGEVTTIQMSRDDIFEAGIHMVDIGTYLAGDAPAEWVMGQVDHRDAEWRKGTLVENQTVGCWKHENGVTGLAVTGQGTDAIGTNVRVTGTDGVLEYRHGNPSRIRGHDEAEWTTFEGEYQWHRPIRRALQDALDGLAGETPPVLDIQHALVSTSIVFGIYESARSGGRIDFPLSIEDNPLEAMVEGQ